MVKVDTVYEDEFKRILRCSEGNRIWYVFFYRKNGGKIKGVLGRERTNNLLDSIL